MINYGNMTYLSGIRKGRDSVLDLALSKSYVSFSWSVDPFRIRGSHLFPITIETKNVSRDIQKFTSKKKLKKNR